MINDIDIAKKILIKDFDHFVDRTMFGLKFDENVEADRIFSQMFMFSKGDDWKSGRTMMSPVFTTGKLKLMYPLLERIHQLEFASGEHGAHHCSPSWQKHCQDL